MTGLRLFISERQADYCQQYENLNLIAVAIFGSSDKEDKQKSNKIDYTNPTINTPEGLNNFLRGLEKR